MRKPLLATAVILSVPLVAQSTESVEASGRTISYRSAVEVLERDGDDKPLKGNTERIGVTLHETGPGAGSFSQVRIVSDWERTGPGGVYSGTLYRVFANGDNLELTFQGQFAKGQAKGTYECASGTGRYAGATCSGAYQSETFDNGMAANHWTGTISLGE
jgi:hypothetical protein